ncbi:hypothetical protein ACT3TY_16585 [Halomonas sp. AOP22-C1-8]|uniref:hypothetical protein n=1 Tax=Halomonas sp. AOP22-C1-8 TaxID=3457717 RepID=UPI0040343DFF
MATITTLGCLITSLVGYSVGLLFLLAALIARGLRYYGLAWLVYRFGNRVLLLWKRHALFTSLIGGVIVLLVALGLQALTRLMM